MNPIRPALPFAMAVLLGLAGLRSQCTLTTAAGDPIAQLRGDVMATTTWDPDGAGPLPQYLVAAGQFAVGTSSGTSVALWDGFVWSPMSLPLDIGWLLTVWNGRLVVAGGWLYRDEIWSFDGVAWSQLGEVWNAATASSGRVTTMTVLGGDLVVGGAFSVVQSSSMAPVTANKVAKWNGSTWSALGAGPSIPAGSYAVDVHAATVFNNALWLGLGYSASGIGTGGVQVWNGSAWVVVGVADGSVETLAARIGTGLTNSFVFAGGRFTTMNGAASPQVVRFTPTTNSWTAIGTPLSSLGTSGCQQLLARSTGISSYEVAGVFETNGADKAWRWTGSAWAALPDIDDFVEMVRLGFHSGHYVVGAAMDPATGLRGFLRAHDSAASTWKDLTGAGIGGAVAAVCHDGQQFVIGGDFATISGTTVNHIACGSAANWQPLGSGFAGRVNAIVRLPNGDLVAGGVFTALGDGTPMQHIARWNGTAWTALGGGPSGGVDGAVHALAVLPNGELVVGGYFANAGGQPAAAIARWNGAAWTAFGTGCNGVVHALVSLANGDLVVGGQFTTAGGQSATNVALWNGSLWSPMGYFDRSVRALAFGSAGIVAGGYFRYSSGWPCDHVARWNPTTGTWEPLGLAAPDRPILALATLPGGDIAIGGGEFVLGNALTCAAVFRSGWQSLGVSGSIVNCLAMDPSGSLLAGGDFARVGAIVSGNVANLGTTCPATATSAAAGCASSGGSNTLAATTLPWANGTLRTHGTGLPAAAIVLVLTSVTPVVPPVPLSALLAQGMPGCNLHVVPDILQALVTTNGTAESVLQLPNVPPIVGVTFYQQMLPIELDAFGAWVAITATNALQLTGGIF